MGKKRGVSSFLQDKGIRSQGGNYNFLEEEEKLTNKKETLPKGNNKKDSTDAVATNKGSTKSDATNTVGTDAVATNKGSTKSDATNTVGTDAVATPMKNVPASFLDMLKNGTLTLRECQILLAMFEEVDFEMSIQFSLSYLELSRKSNIHQPHIPKTLKSLVGKGIIERSTGKGNKNFYRLTL